MGKGRIILDKFGRPNHPIYSADKKVIGTSRNLAGIRRYVSKNLISRLDLEGPLKSGVVSDDGVLSIKFDDGANYRTTFASYTVLCGWVLRWRNAWGAPLWINGVECGKVEKDNDVLIQHSKTGGVK